jgi:putative flavoprotein involved in K+ transport
MKPNTAQRDVVVIGGGQAGLAIGHHLAQAGRSFTILEAADAPAAAWRSRWDSLKLFTPVRYDSLPGLQFPGDPDSYPGRDDVVDYLSEYARHFDLPVELRSRVTSVRRADEGDGYRVEVDDGRVYEASQVVVATGPFQVPRTPAIARELDGDVFQIHSSEYRTPDALPPGPVLVVGGGNTGYQIAAELTKRHETHLAIGSKQTPLPQRILGRDLFTFLERGGMMRKSVETRLGRKASQRDTLIGSTRRGLRRQGVAPRPRAVEAAGTEVRFEDGSSMTPSAVIWATGFAVDHSWIDVPDVFDDAGRAVHRRGVTESPGLYFLGLPWLHTRGSALLGWVKDDAQYIADRIGELGTPAPARTATTPTPSQTQRTHA